MQLSFSSLKCLGVALTIGFCACVVQAVENPSDRRAAAQEARRLHVENLKSLNGQMDAPEKLQINTGDDTREFSDSLTAVIIDIDSMAKQLDRDDPYSVLCAYLNAWKCNDLQKMNSLLIDTMRRPSLSEFDILGDLKVHCIFRIPDASEDLIRFHVVMDIDVINQGSLTSGRYDWECYMFRDVKENWLVSGCGF